MSKPIVLKTARQKAEAEAFDAALAQCLALADKGHTPEEIRRMLLKDEPHKPQPAPRPPHLDPVTVMKRHLATEH